MRRRRKGASLSFYLLAVELTLRAPLIVALIALAGTAALARASSI